MDKNQQCYGAFLPFMETSTSTMTRTANCARHLGVIVGKMLPNPFPKYTHKHLQPKEEILSHPHHLSVPNWSHLVKEPNLDRIAFSYKIETKPE